MILLLSSGSYIPVINPSYTDLHSTANCGSCIPHVPSWVRKLLGNVTCDKLLLMIRKDVQENMLRIVLGKADFNCCVATQRRTGVHRPTWYDLTPPQSWLCCLSSARDPWWAWSRFAALSPNCFPAPHPRWAIHYASLIGFKCEGLCSTGKIMVTPSSTRRIVRPGLGTDSCLIYWSVYSRKLNCWPEFKSQDAAFAG